MKIDEKILKDLQKKYSGDNIFLDLINELALVKGYIDLYPYLTLKTIDEILEKKHANFYLVNVDLKKVEEGSMAMEYSYEIIFKQSFDSNFYGIKLNKVPLIEGDQWYDYVSSGEDETFKIFPVSEEKETKIIWKFKE